MTVVPLIDTQVKGHCSLYAFIFCALPQVLPYAEHTALCLDHNLIIYWIDSGCFQDSQGSVLCYHMGRLP